METRLTTLEERYMAQEHALQELSDVVWEQARAIGRLEKKVKELEERLRGRDESDAPIPNEPPPHY